jgi:hypothetical protein
MMNTRDKARLIMRLVRERRIRSIHDEPKQKSKSFDQQNINSLGDEIKLYQIIVSHKSHPSALNGEWKKLEG